MKVATETVHHIVANARDVHDVAYDFDDSGRPELVLKLRDGSTLTIRGSLDELIMLLGLVAGRVHMVEEFLTESSS